MISQLIVTHATFLSLAFSSYPHESSLYAPSIYLAPNIRLYARSFLLRMSNWLAEALVIPKDSESHFGNRSRVPSALRPACPHGCWGHETKSDTSFVCGAILRGTSADRLSGAAVRACILRPHLARLGYTPLSRGRPVKAHFVCLEETRSRESSLGHTAALERPKRYPQGDHEVTSWPLAYHYEGMNVPILVGIRIKRSQMTRYYERARWRADNRVANRSRICAWSSP